MEKELELVSLETSDLVNEENIDHLFNRVALDETESEHIAAEPYSYWKSVLRAFIKKPSAIIGLVVLGLLVLGMIFIPLFAPEGAYDFNIDIANKAPSKEHLFGTDLVGRDLFFMLWEGMKLSLFLALIEAAIIIFVGTLVGLAWGYFRWLDRIMIEVYNLITNIPSLLIYMLLASIIKEAFPLLPPEARLIISLTITGWIGTAYSIRNLTWITRDREYNVASSTLGTPPMRVMIRNLLPYLLPVVIQSASMTIPGMISSEVSMSFFGVGLPTDTISVGILLDQGRAYFMDYPWQLLAPAGILATVILGFYLIGLALSDALDPKTHR